LTIGSEDASCRDAGETLRSERLFAELEELSKCRAAVCSEVNLSEVPDLEEVDAREAQREGLLLQRVAAATPSADKYVDPELEGLD